jgi:hypothetical protein
VIADSPADDVVAKFWAEDKSQPDTTQVTYDPLADDAAAKSSAEDEYNLTLPK